MTRILFAAALLLSVSSAAFAADDVVGVVAGTVKKVDAGTKVMAVETDTGVKHTFHYSEKLAIHGTTDAGKALDEATKGPREGGRVAVHYTAEGTRETAREVDLLGRGGLKETKGTVTDRKALQRRRKHG